MKRGGVAIKVLHILVACLVMGSSLGWFSGSVIASSRTQAPDFSIDSNPTQNMAIESSLIASNPLNSPANGTWEVTDTIQLSGTERPLQIAVSGGRAYISRNPGHLTVLDLSTNMVVTTISFDPYTGAAPHYIGILGDKAYVALSNLGSDGQLAIINIANNTVTGYIPVGADPYGVATFGQKVYVTNNVWWSSGDPATVKVVDANTNSVVATIPVGINPTGIAVDSVSRKAYVTNRNDLSKSVSVIDTNTNSVIATIPMNNPPAGVAISGNRAYVTTVVNMPNGTVEVIDISADSIVSSIPVGRDSWGVAASDSYVFVANQSSSTVSVIEVATNSVVATVDVGDDPTHAAVDPSTNKVYVANQGDNTISVIEFIGTSPPTNQQPAVSITAPSNNEDVSGILNIQGTASDPDGSDQLQKVEVTIDAGSWVQASGTTSWSYSWDTATTSNGQHSIYARCYDGQAYSNETSLVVTVSNQAVVPSIIDVGITAETILPPETFLQANPGDRFVVWYDIAYSGPRMTVKLKTTIIDPGGKEIHDPLGDPGLVLMEDMPGHTGWVGDDFKIPDTATLGIYNVKFSVWSEDGTQQHNALVKSGWLILGSDEKPDIGSIASISFGDVTVGSNSDKTATVHNEGETTLTINNITRTAGSTDFTFISPSAPFNVEAGGSQTVTIRFAPSSEGSKNAAFNINSNDPDETNVTFNVAGSGVLQKGTINVNSDPSGASFTLSGPASYSGITPWNKTDAPIGTYVITWTPISGYQIPQQESKTLTQGETVSFYGDYQIRKGTIEVNSNPSDASFTLSGPANYSGVTPWSRSDAPAGTYLITWGFIKGYEIPSPESKTLEKGEIISFYGAYQLGKGAIKVTSNPSGASFTLSGPEDYSGTTPWSKDDALAGTYTITWGFVSGYDALPQESETLTQDGMLSFYGDYTVKEAFPGANTATLWEYYSAWGKTLPSLSERAKMYEALGLGSTDSYAGTAEQNTRLLNVLKERQICPLTGEEVGWVAPQATLADLIQQQATGGIPVTVDGELYIILTLRNRIDPVTLKVVPNSGVTKVYVYGDRNDPVSVPEITQKIGIIDYMREIQADEFSLEQLGQKIDSLNKKARLFAAIQFGEESIRIITEIPTSISLKAIAEWIGEKVAGEFLRKMAELNQELSSNLASSESKYQEVLRQVVRNKNGFTDYDTACVVLNDYLSAVSYENRYRFLYDMVYGRYLGEEGALVKLSEVALRFLTLSISEEIVAQTIEKEYLAFVQNEERRLQSELQLRLSGLHEAASYTLELAQSPRLAVEVHSPVELRVYDSEQRVTGLVNGEERNEIPYSVYHDNSVTIFSPTDLYNYEVVGTGEGSYALSVTTIAEGVNTFIREEEPTSAKAVHQYSIDWEALSKGKKGVTMRIDANGDGTFEEIRKLGSEGAGFSWVWIVVAGASGLLGVLAGAFIVRRRASKKSGT